MKNQNATLGVIIVNYNGGDLLPRCIEQLLGQSPVPGKIIVVDNGSEDGSMDSLPEHGALEILLLDENTGFAAANNLALTHLQDVDLIMTLNPDAFVQPGCLEALLDAAATHVDYDSFACRMMSSDTVLDGAGDSYHFSGLVWRNRHGGVMRESDLLQREVFSPCAGAALYRRPALDQVGGFDEAYFCYIEDVDLGYRLKLAGKRCLYVPDATVDHIGSAISDKYPGFAVYHGHRNLVWTFVKNTPLCLLLLMLPFHLIMSILVFFRLLANGQGSVYLRAKKDAIKGLPRVWRQRKKILSNRQIRLSELLISYDYSFFRR